MFGHSMLRVFEVQYFSVHSKANIHSIVQILFVFFKEDVTDDECNATINSVFSV